MKFIRIALVAALLSTAAALIPGGASASPLAGPTRCYDGVGIMVAVRGLSADEVRHPEKVRIARLKPLMVMQVVPGGPAEEGHIYRGDIIVKVDGKSVIGMTPNEVVSLLDGPAITTVTVTIRRNGGHIQRDIVLTRSTVCISTP